MPDMIDRFRRWIGFLLLTNKSFRLHRWFGVHVTPVHFYSPIPDIRELEKREDWGRPSEMVGVDMNEAEQKRCLEEIVPRFITECNFPAESTSTPYDFYIGNVYFGYVSAAAMHCFVRSFRPQRVVDVGAGFTTRILARAGCMNAEDGHLTEVIAVEPYPSTIFQHGFPGLTKLIADQVQNVDINFFTNLQANDILSIDTSHVVRTHGDVTYLCLEVLPRLRSGVIVHIHDIFLPFDYPFDWFKRRIFWSEQYLIHAFMVYNSGFELIWAQKYSEATWPDLHGRAFGGRTSLADNFQSNSLWIRRK